jgi:hypothetical protein
MGDKLLQKTYSIDFLSKDRLKNEGQDPQYYVEQDHEAIIPPETFKRVQDELERRKGCHATGGNIFSGKIYCGECGQIYGSKVWHSNDPYRKVIWRCNDKYGGERKCSTPVLTEIEIKGAFEQVLEKMSMDKAEIIRNLKEIVAALDPGELVAQKEKLERDRDSIAALAQDAVNMRATQDQERITELAAEYDRLDSQVRELEQEIVGVEARIRRINEFIRAYKASGEEFSEDGWCTMVEKVTVWRDKMVFTLTTGVEVEV